MGIVGRGGKLKEVKDKAERELLERVLSECNGNLRVAAKFLEVSRAALYEAMARHNMSRVGETQSVPEEDTYSSGLARQILIMNILKNFPCDRDGCGGKLEAHRQIGHSWLPDIEALAKRVDEEIG